jgi:hypothetical protein
MTKPSLSLALAVLGLTMPAASLAKPSSVTSAYTKLDLDRCTLVETDEVGSFANYRCPGIRGVPLIVEVGDDRYDLDAGVADRDELWGQTFDEPGTSVEWRLQRGRPFALIYRLTGTNPERPRTSRLLVETIGRPGKPGCRVAEIAGSAPNANQAARDAAAKILAGTARCLDPKSRR